MGRRLKIWDQMNKLYGNSGNLNIGPVEPITTGSYALDEAIGIWGIPKGRIVQYAGKESSGKTLMSLIAIREWQKLDPENWAIFIDAEDTFNQRWAETIDVDIDRLFMIESNEGVEIWTQLCGVPHKDLGKPKIKPGILDLEKENPSGLGIIVLDSIASINTPIEMTKQVGNTNIAPMGRFLPDALKRLTPLLSHTGVVFIAINQVRVDVGKMFGDPQTTPGGKAWKHACSLMVHFTMSESKKSHFIDDVSGKKIGHIAGARIDKNKCNFSGCKCEFEITNFAIGELNKKKEAGNLAIKYGVVKRPNNRTYIYGENKWISRDSFFGAIDDDLMFELIDKVKEAKRRGVSLSEEDREEGNILEERQIIEEE